jgi:hypothetical protein
MTVGGHLTTATSIHVIRADRLLNVSGRWLGSWFLGLFWGAWGAVLPAVQASSGSTDGELGAGLLMIGSVRWCPCG